MEDLASGDKLKLSDKSLQVYRMLTQYVARDNSGLSLARRKVATYIWIWIISVIPDATIQACQRNATESRALEKIILSVILNINQSTGIEKDDDSRQSLENHAKIDEIRRFSNKKFDSCYDVRGLLENHEAWGVSV